MKYDITAIGELLIDFAPVSSDKSGYPTLAAKPGGAPCNLLASASAYGCSTAFIGKVGEDSFGKLLTKTLEDTGIETRGIVTDSGCFTTLAFVTLDSGGNREFSFARKPGADTRLEQSEIDLALIDDCRDFHFGSLSLTDEPARSATRYAVKYAKEKGKLISFDPNLRRPLWKSLDNAKAEMLWGISQADIVKISDEELEFLFGCGYEEGAEKLRGEYGVKLVFATLGADGCYYSGAAGSGTVRPPADIEVRDTTGAGDIFGGAALAGILKTGKALEEITNAELYEMTRFACCAASLSTQYPGGISSVQPAEAVKNIMRQR